MSKPPIPIYVGTTSIYVPCNRNGMVSSGIYLGNFVRNVLEEREWDPKLGAMISVNRFTDYDETSGCARLPRMALDALKVYLGEAHVQEIPAPAVTPRHANIRMKKKIEPRVHQVPVIEFMSNTENGYKPIESGCGEGKTAMSIFASANLQVTTMIVLSFLVEQWYKSIRDFTRLATHEIYVIKGFDSLKKLWEMADNGYRPKVIIFSARTLFLYGVEQAENYKDLRPYSEFQQVFGIGLKIMDEVHLGFNTNVRIDLVSNIKHNIYLSATYLRNSSSGRKIFDLIYPENLRYGSGERARHVNCFMFEYSLGIFPSELRKFKVAKGYNHAMYENYIRSKNAYLSPFLYKVLLPLINRHYLEKKKPGQRLLILTQTKLFAEEVYNFIKPQLPMNEIHLFFSNEAKHGNPKNLLGDIIISTNKSCGVGRDIKELKTCINTISFASEPQALQMIGRLRQIPGEETVYVDMWNRDVPSHSYHQAKRAQAYRGKAASYLATTI